MCYFNALASVNSVCFIVALYFVNITIKSLTYINNCVCILGVSIILDLTVAYEFHESLLYDYNVTKHLNNT